MGVHDGDYTKAKKALGIPEDEPIFVIRGKDDLALHAVVSYANVAKQIEDPNVAPSSEWFEQLEGVAKAFANFRNANPDRMQVPN